MVDNVPVNLIETRTGQTGWYLGSTKPVGAGTGAKVKAANGWFLFLMRLSLFFMAFWILLA